MKYSAVGKSVFGFLLVSVACSDSSKGVTGDSKTGGSSQVSAGGTPAVGGIGGTNSGSGGTILGVGGTSIGGMGGTNSGTGGSSSGSGGGSNSSTGGSNSSTGGSNSSTGGSNSSTGGSNSGTGGSGPLVPTERGFISIHDPVPGWASVAGGTKGGGTDLGSAITVKSMAELQGAAGGSEAKIILVEPGTYIGVLEPGPNKTIIGTAPGVIINGNIKISGADKISIIIRNIAVRMEKCSSYTACRSGGDAVYIGQSAHHIWLDHMDIADGHDGNCDITRAGDYITASWSKFHYTYVKEHAFSNLIASSGGETESRGKLQITYMNCWWGENVTGRQPMGRFGKVHNLNNYHKNNPTFIHEVNTELSLIAEKCYYDVPGKSIFKGNGAKGFKGIGNEGTANGLNESYGTVFEIPYPYTAMSAGEAKIAVTSPEYGAGNTCRLKR